MADAREKGGDEGDADAGPQPMHPALLRRLASRMQATCELVLPAAPSLTDHYTQTLLSIFALLGSPFSEGEAARLREIVHGKLEEGFRLSPYANVFASFSTRRFEDGIRYGIATAPSTIEEEYAAWAAAREPVLFGKYPDAKVIDLAASLGPRARCLDLGAGTGRNALALVERGYEVDAVELAPALIERLERAARRRGLSVRVLPGDALDEHTPIDEGAYPLAVVSEVTSHFRDVEDLRALMERLAYALAPGGLAVINIFLPVEGYVPDRVARELGQVFWSSFFTRDELAHVLEGLPLERVSDEAVVAYEREHLPEGAWPPTPWYEHWAQGGDVFAGDHPPAIELRWLVLRRC